MFVYKNSGTFSRTLRLSLICRGSHRHHFVGARSRVLSSAIPATGLPIAHSRIA